MDDMTELRLQMDDIDDKIFELFNERADVAERIGQYKRANGVRVYDRTRERTKVADATSKVPDDLKTYAQVLMELLMDAYRSWADVIVTCTGSPAGDAQQARQLLGL